GPAGRSLQCDSCWTSQLTAQETACLEAQPRRRETELPQEARFLTRFPTGASTFDAVRVCLEIRTLDAKTLRRRERRREKPCLVVVFSLRTSASLRLCVESGN